MDNHVTFPALQDQQTQPQQGQAQQAQIEPTQAGALPDTPPLPYTRELDARGLNCPLPILRCKKGLAELAGGEVLRVLATDPGSVKDFQAFCRQTGHEMLAFQELDAVPKKEFIFHIRKRSS